MHGRHHPVRGIDQLERTDDLDGLAGQFLAIKLADHLRLNLVVQRRTGILRRSRFFGQSAKLRLTG